MPGDVQLAVDFFLDLVGLAASTQVMGFSGSGGQYDGAVAMGLENTLNCIPTTSVPRLFERPKDVSQKLVGQNVDEDMAIDAVFFLVAVGA